LWVRFYNLAAVRLLRRKEIEEDRDEQFMGDLDELLAEIERVGALAAAGPDRDSERRLLRLRHIAGTCLIDRALEGAEFVAPDALGVSGPSGGGLPVIERGALTAAAVRAGILAGGCVRVPSLIPRQDALELEAAIERAFTERERQDVGEPADPGYYREFRPRSRFGEVFGRDWIRQGGGVLAADSPQVEFQLMALLRAAGIRELVGTYLGESPVVSVHKTTLRKAMPATVRDAWHQDGYFMGPVRALNLWISLSHCGDDAPGMAIIPRRFDEFLITNTEGAPLDYTISEQKAAEAAGDTPIVRPIFEPGDALLFDEWCVHSTAADLSMPNPRYAVENWFFGASGFPDMYAPLSV
jgi:hypothetical protein